MAGRKVFTSGEILTAADVNSYLMDQVVAVFADSSARSSAIPSPTEGMVTFREDQDVVEVYDGSAFKTVGGLVAVKSALKTDTEVFGSVAAGGNVAVTDLSITHEVSDPANKLIITISAGALGDDSGRAATGFAVSDGTSFLGVGDANADSSRVSAGGRPTSSGDVVTVTSRGFSFVHTPGSGSKTYSLHLFNVDGVTRTLFLNRTELDTGGESAPRAASALVIQEVAV